MPNKPTRPETTWKLSQRLDWPDFIYDKLDQQDIKILSFAERSAHGLYISPSGRLVLCEGRLDYEGEEA